MQLAGTIITCSQKARHVMLLCHVKIATLHLTISIAIVFGKNENAHGSLAITIFEHDLLIV